LTKKQGVLNPRDDINVSVLGVLSKGSRQVQGNLGGLLCGGGRKGVQRCWDTWSGGPKT